MKRSNQKSQADPAAPEQPKEPERLSEEEFRQRFVELVALAPNPGVGFDAFQEFLVTRAADLYKKGERRTALMFTRASTVFDQAMAKLVKVNGDYR